MESFHQENDDDNSMLHEENKNDNKKKNLGVTPIIISPRRSKESIMTIRAHKVHQEGDSITSKIGHLFGSFKEKTTDYVEKVQTKHKDINSFATTKVQAGTNIKKEKEGGQQQFVIPIIEENYNLSKKILSEDVKIEKRWIIHDEKLHLPIAYEKIFVDDKELDSYSKEDIFSQIKDKIINFQYIGESDEDENKIEKEKKEDIKRQQNEKDRRQARVKEDNISLFDDDDEGKLNSTSSTTNNEILNDKTQKVIPLYAEQLIITKKKVKIGEIVIMKKEVIEEKKVNIDIVKERVTIEYPNGKKERLTEK
jgi:stress response protein YsnF